MSKIQPVLLCGGSGTRLWPLSRAGFPKQFICLTGDESLFQQAVRRTAKIGAGSAQEVGPCIVGNEQHRFLAQEQLRECGVGDATFLLEPVGRNTAPALTLAALAAREGGNDPVLVVTPADQIITDESAFQSALQGAIVQAEKGDIVTLGITPDRPETGYGYIKLVDSDDTSRVEHFVEKPDRETAERYLVEGGYYWNAGLFVLKASVWLTALERFRPDMATACNEAWAARTTDGAFIRPGKSAFEHVPSESIDYAVMENCPGSEFTLRVVPLAAGWSDLGAWDAVWAALPKDAAGNASRGDVLLEDSRNTLVHASSRLVSVVGVDNLVVVETPDAVLVADKARCQDVKRIVNELGRQQRAERVLHRKVHRPWGWYDSIDEGGRFKVKRIRVKPKASLSLQKHFHRAEHWTVVSGTAEVTNGEQTILLTENQSTYIPLGQVHRLANPGTIPLEIVEVQSGSYLGEDDIVRFEDVYGRTGS
ncbi:MAG: mannose-1-phosphate guanylyltransferase/mannose-6-phosphate isomerase [Nevskiaceae bacterium]|nr:MAG: mannose-1-phosphate guanylyltransferase/mannose-6-phosphate isomerase [Nevskiaceae bacterium]TBR74899.1 MAG: mannose-1-phosphate guanylyltransferase/mannose-6-phosphate isomerase [Nevskiaceae bacterium]